MLFLCVSLDKMQYVLVRTHAARKLWSAVASFISMLIVALKGTDELAVQITALIMGGAAIIAYIIGEGLTDAAGLESGGKEEE